MLPACMAPYKDVNHLTAQEYTNWKFKSTGRYEKAIGHFYGNFETSNGCQVPSGLFHDKHVIHIPGQTRTAPIVNARDPSKFYGEFTTKDGYQVPPGHFHSPDLVAVAGQAMDMHISAVAKPSPNSVPSPVKVSPALGGKPVHLDSKDAQGAFKPSSPGKLGRNDYSRATTTHGSAASTPTQSDRANLSNPSSPPHSSCVSRARSPDFRPRISLARFSEFQKPAAGFASPKSDPRPVVVSRPSLMAVPALQAPRIGRLAVMNSMKP